MRIYFMGICGTAMGNVALMLKQMGHDVCGADTGMYPPMSDVLAASDIELYEGYDPTRLERLEPDLVVVGNVISRGHPEIEWLLETRKFRYTSVPALLSELVLTTRNPIVVSGTHGKTTTTALTTVLLQANGHEPGWLVGGIPRDLPTGSNSGKRGSPFVIEGDEYDSAFFDKRSKFIHYQPQILIVNNLEFDHADIFIDLDDVKKTFTHVTRLVPRTGYILANGDDENVMSLMPSIDWTTIYTVGTNENSSLRIVDFTEDTDGARFRLIWQGKEWATVDWDVHGLYNARNAAMAALAAGLSVDPLEPAKLDLTILSAFQGVKRRQEMLLNKEGLVVFEDFAHHPTAIKEALASFRNRYPEHRIIAAFEPRSNTAARKVFQQKLPESFVDADVALIGAVHRAERYSDEERLDTNQVCAALMNMKSSITAKAFTANSALLEMALEEAAKEDETLVVFFSNGSFDGVHKEFVERV